MIGTEDSDRSFCNPEYPKVGMGVCAECVVKLLKDDCSNRSVVDAKFNLLG